MRTTPIWVMMGLVATGCGPRETQTTAGLIAAGSGEACSTADTEAQLTAAIAPDTSLVKQQAEAGDYPMRPADVDSLAQGLTYKLDAVTAARIDKSGHAITCNAQLVVASTQYGVTSDPMPIAYRVASPAGQARIVVTPIGSAAKDGALAIFQQVAQKLSEVFRTQADQDAAASATDSMLSAHPSRDPAVEDPLAAMANGAAAP